MTALQGVRNELHAVTVQLGALWQVQKELGPSIDRLDALERQHHQFEAMCEGLLLKAEGKLRSANNAEARTRADKKSYEHLIDPLAEDGLEPETEGSPVLANDAAPSEADRLLGMRMAVASTNPKTLAQRAKFGLK